MKPGEYKFTGGKIIMKEKANEEQKIILNEEEIFKEINKRKNQQKKKQTLQNVEILDKFYAIVEFDGKPITKIIKKKQKLSEYEQENSKQQLMISQKKNYGNNSFNS